MVVIVKLLRKTMAKDQSGSANLTRNKLTFTIQKSGAVQVKPCTVNQLLFNVL